MKDDERAQEAQQTIRTSRVKPDQLWIHNKSQGVYRIVCLSVDEETLRPLVTYQSIGLGHVWTRTLDIFLGPSGDDGEPRFTMLSS